MVERLKSTEHVKTGSDDDFEFDELEAGTHKCELTDIRNCDLPVWRDRQMTKETQPGLRFIWKVEGKKAWITHSVNHTVNEKGNLLKIMRQCHDSMLSKLKFNEKGYLEKESEDVFYYLLDECKNWKYNVTMKYQEGKNGKKYTKFVSCEPLKDELVGIAKIDPQYGQEQTSFEDDEIPF